MGTNVLNALAAELEKNGEIAFTHGYLYYKIWETDQGEDNSRGGDYMNYMIDVFDFKEFIENGYDTDVIEAIEGALCTGTPADAITMMMGE